MVKKYKKVTEPSSIGSSYDPDLVNKLNEYSLLTGIKRTELVSNLIAKELKGKVLNNKYISLEEPLYFNYKELLEKGSVKCTSTKPTTNLQDTNIIKNMPNNLDRFIEKEDYFTYGFEDNPNQHKGIRFSFNDGYEDKPKYLVFELDTESEIILKISILELNDLTTYLDIDQYKKTIKKLKKYPELLEKNIETEYNFYKKHKELLDTNNIEYILVHLSEEEKIKVGDIVALKIHFRYLNYKIFIPLEVYSALQNLILVFDKKNDEEFKKIQKEVYGTDLTKQELEQFINNFKYISNSKFLFLFDKILFGFEKENEGQKDLLNEFIAEYLTGDENTTELIKKLKI